MDVVPTHVSTEPSVFFDVKFLRGKPGEANSLCCDDAEIDAVCGGVCYRLGGRLTTFFLTPVPQFRGFHTFTGNQFLHFNHLTWFTTSYIV